MIHAGILVDQSAYMPVTGSPHLTEAIQIIKKIGNIMTVEFV